MPASVKCPGCQSALKIPDKALGKSIRCPKCKKALKVGAPKSTSPVQTSPKTQPSPNRKKAVRPKSPSAEEVFDERSLDLVEDSESEFDEEHLDMVEDDVMDAGDLDMVGEGDEDPDEIDELLIPPGADPFEGIDIDEETQESILSELTKNERVLWIGVPSARIVEADDRRSKLIAIPLCSVFVLVGVILLIVGSVNEIVGLMIAGPIFAVFAGLMLFLILKFGTGTRFGTYYLLTNRRVIVWLAFSRMQEHIRSFSALDLEDMKREEHLQIKGAGDLLFTRGYGDRIGASPGNPVSAAGDKQGGIGFRQIENVKKIEHLVRRVLIDKAVDRWLQ